MQTSELEEQLFELMRTHRNTMRRFFQSIGMFNGHPHMLFHIRQHPGLTQKQLAEAMQIAPASVAVSVKRMEAAGLVERRPDPADRRNLHLYLTPAGEEMDTACSRGKDFMAHALFQDFTPDEAAALSALLQHMTQNLEHASSNLQPKEDPHATETT